MYRAFAPRLIGVIADASGSRPSADRGHRSPSAADGPRTPPHAPNERASTLLPHCSTSTSGHRYYPPPVPSPPPGHNHVLGSCFVTSYAPLRLSPTMIDDE